MKWEPQAPNAPSKSTVRFILVIYPCLCVCHLIPFTAKPSCDDPDDVECFENDNLSISVPCDGSPKPVCKWTKDGGNIDTKDGHFTITENNGVYNVLIKAATMDDAGSYQAEFTNRAGEKKIACQLLVHCKFFSLKDHIILCLKNLGDIFCFVSSSGRAQDSQVHV